MDKLRALLNKYSELITYVVVGLLTTLIDYSIYYPMFYFTGAAAACKALSWCGAVTFSFFANKIFVFKKKDWSFRTVIGEFLRFVSARAGSVLAEMAILHVTVNLLHWNGYVMPLVTGVLVTVTNFVTTKYVAFKNMKKNS